MMVILFMAYAEPVAFQLSESFLKSEQHKYIYDENKTRNVTVHIVKQSHSCL